MDLVYRLDFQGHMVQVPCVVVELVLHCFPNVYKVYALNRGLECIPHLEIAEELLAVKVDMFA